MFHKIVSFFCFILKSKNEHGVHSPFIFDLITTCFYVKKNNHDLTILSNYKEDLSKNSSLQEIYDFNFLSNILLSEKKKKEKIIKDFGVSNKRTRLLINLIQYLKPRSILEIGTSVGINTVTLASALENFKIITVEENEQSTNISRELFKKYNLKQIELLSGKLDDVLPDVFKKNTFDFICFKNHGLTKKVLKYFEASVSSIHNNSVCLFKNIHIDKESDQVWEQIKKHEKVTVTIDTFKWGLVFFRKEQEKEHFIIRI